MADLIRHWPRLAPTGDAAIDQARVARGAGFGTEAQPLHDAGTETLDQGVGAFDQAQDPVAIFWRFQIDRHGGSAAMQDFAADVVEHGGGRAAAPCQTKDLGAHVGQDHTGEGDRPQAVDFDDA
ncbi:hypothetical protein D3C72_715910 [compost metagenome]